MLKAQGTKEDRRLKAVKAFLSKLHTGQRKEDVETNITNSEDAGGARDVDWIPGIVP